jgi:hypothetical protein
MSPLCGPVSPPPPQAQATAVQGQVIQASLSHEAYRHAGGGWVEEKREFNKEGKIFILKKFYR